MTNLITSENYLRLARWNVGRFNMPAGLLLRAYDYHDETGEEFVGYCDEIRNRCKMPVWRLTGIGRVQLELRLRIAA